MTTPGTWDDMTSRATLGLARDTRDLPPPSHASIALPHADRPATFLRTAATALLWKLAGDRIVAGPTIAPSDLPEERQAPEAAARRLARMLVDEPRHLVPEWLELASRSNLVLPAAWVPPIFEAMEPELRQRHAAVFGETLARLATLDERWKVVGPSLVESDAAWTAGTVDERISALRSIRARDPAQGRTWVASTWETDPPDLRERALEALQVGLAPDDEPLLERALDDRRKSVRVAAADALGRLRDSAFVQRACARLQPHFVLHPRGAGLLGRFTGRRLEITLPTGLDKAAQRDALELKPPAGRKIGERAWWLLQMLAAVPPDVHLARFECSPGELLDAAGHCDHATEVVDALLLATVRWRAADWIAPVAAAVRRRETGPEPRPLVTQALASLVQSLIASERAVPLLAQVEALVDQEQWEAAFALLTQVDADWTPDLTRRALGVLERHVGGNAARWAPARTTLDEWAGRVDLQVAEPLLAKLVRELPPEVPWRNAIERMHDLTKFRIEMRKELSA